MYSFIRFVFAFLRLLKEKQPDRLMLSKSHTPMELKSPRPNQEANDQK